MAIYEEYMVSASQLYSAQISHEILERNKIINICIYGGRSSEASRRLTNMGYPAVFLSCGLSGLSDLEENYQNMVTNRINLFPEIYVFANELEQIKYRPLLGKINVPETNIFYKEADLLKKVCCQKSLSKPFFDPVT